jgi:RsiW-degrading membrane proteinase PrsW (M82 family)
VSAAKSIRAVRVCAAALCIFGAVVLTWQFVRYLKVFPGGVAAAVVLELPLLLVGFAVARLLRPVRMPPVTWSAAALIWGGTAAAGCALLANRGLIGLWFKGAGVAFASGWSDALSAPLNEELLKVCGVVMIVLAAPLVINGPMDALIFGALTGLGFQVTENVIYGLNSIVLSGATNPGQAVLNSALVRVGTTGPGSHWTMTAVAGAGIGYLVERGRRGGPVMPAIACLLLAMSMHLLFDAPDVIVEIKVGVNFVIVAALYVLLRHAFLERAHELLAAWTGAGLIGQSEARSALSRRRRRTELRRAASPVERYWMLRRQREIMAAIEREAA